MKRIVARSSRFLVGLALCLACTLQAAGDTVRQSERRIPIAGEVDVVVVAGSLRAVAAAVAAAENDADVLLVASRTWLGDAMCGTLCLWLEEGERPTGSLTGAIFGDRRVTTPLEVKKTLEAALLDAGVDFLFASYPTNVLSDARGNVAGVVIANRAGRQAITAKVVIDATHDGAVARMAGAGFRAVDSPSPTRGKSPCRRVVLGGKAESKGEPVGVLPSGERFGGEIANYYVYELNLDLGDGGGAAIARAEQQARDLTYRPGQLRSAERLAYLPSARILGQGDAGRFRPKGIARLFVLGPAADVSRGEAQRLLRPVAGEAVGRQIGRAAAAEAAALPAASDVHVKACTPNAAGANERGPALDVREILQGLRPTGKAARTVPCRAGDVAVLDQVDVLVIGGGTSGSCAAIGAARQGADVLVVEFQEGLGGVGTVGLIGRPYHGRNEGFTKEVPFCDNRFTSDDKMEWFRREIRKAGGEIWLRSIGCGAVCEGNRVRGAVVVTPQGRGVVLADVVIDSTGNADVAAAAGAETRYGGNPCDIAMQGAGLPPRPLGRSYVNTDYLLVDETDLLDVKRALVGVRLAGEAGEFDVGPFIQTRERRRMVGDFWMTYLDQIAGRTYPDSVVLSGSDYDSHGYPSEAYFALFPHTEATLEANHPAPGGTCYTPYRSLLPKGIEGLLVTGLGISMHRDASALVRMQKDMHNQGYAAGVAAAMAARQGMTPRQIDVKALQRHLVQRGNLPASVLADVDSFPPSEDELRTAVASLTSADRRASCIALARVLANAGAAKPIVRQAFHRAEGTNAAATASEEPAKLFYARLLGFMGEDDGVELLVDELNAVDRWDAKIFQGRMAEYAHLPTRVDSLILALGAAGNRRAVPAILEKLAMLDAEVTLSHHRAVAVALEQLADPGAAKPLADLLARPGMGGHALTEIKPLDHRDKSTGRRTGPLREIVLARALYRCGDYQGLGESILKTYKSDIRGLFARHATEILRSD